MSKVNRHINGNLVIFDLDGTLLNTIEDLGCAVNHALSLKGFPEHQLKEYRKMVGNGVRNLVTRALPPDAGTAGTAGTESFTQLVDSVLSDFRQYYSAHIHLHTRPYEGIPELLRKLDSEGYSLAVASNKFQEGTEALIGHFFGGIQFTAVLGNRDGAALKPSPEIIQEAVASSPGIVRTIMVGDSETDIATAKAAGIASVAVSWGFRTKDALLEADRIAEDTSSLYGILKELSL